MGIAEFINARLDEDEQVAQTAIDGDPQYAEWAYAGEFDSYSSGEVYAPNSPSGSENYPRYVTMDREGILSSVEPQQAVHIARHDPARVLREVAAKRDLIRIACHVNWMDSVSLVGDEALEAMAAVYADHPDYRTDW